MNRTEASESSWLARGSEAVLAVLLLTAFLSIQVLIGGTRLLFAFPAYALLAVIAVLSLISIRKAKPVADQLSLWSAVIFFSYVLLRAILSPAVYLARFDIYSVLSGLVVYFFTACVFTSPKARMWILAGLLTAALAHVFVGVIQFTGGKNFMPIASLQRFDYGRRASGFYICPNHLAGLLEVLGIFGLSLICWSRWPVWGKLLIGYATAACYAGVILTASRGGYLSAIASVLVFGALSLVILRAAGRNAMVRIGLPGAIAALFAITATGWLIHKSEDLSARVKIILDDKNVRLDFWRAAIEQWKLEPVVGTGSRTYQFYGRKFRADRVQYDPVYVHNDYLQLLADYGIIGVITFAPFFFAHVRRGWLDWRRLGPKRIALSHGLSSNTMALNVGALGAIGAYAVHSVFDFNLHIPANVLLLAFVFGILANPGLPRPSAREGPMTSWRILLATLGLLLGIQVWRLAPGEYYAERARVALRDYRALSAVSAASKGIEYEKENPNLFQYLGNGRMLAGQAQTNPEARSSFFEAALPPFARARELVPLDKTYSLELAFAYDALSRFPEAEWMYNEAQGLDPRSTAVRDYYAAHLDRWRKWTASGPEAETPPAK